MATCQQFPFFPAEIISHCKICLQEAGKKSILLFQLLAMRSGFCWQAIFFWQAALLARRGGIWPDEQNILLASSNYFSSQDLLASSWQEVNSAPLRHISPPSFKQLCLPAISFLASRNHFSWQDLLARSWQEVSSALPTSCHEKLFLLASKLFAGKQRCLQEGGYMA